MLQNNYPFKELIFAKVQFKEIRNFVSNNIDLFLFIDIPLKKRRSYFTNQRKQ